MTSFGGWGVPGSGALVETTEVELFWGGDAGKGLAIYQSGLLDGATRDAGNTPTTVLRTGLLLGQLTANSKWTEYDPAATDGSEVATGILAVETRAQDFDATDQDRVVPILVAGPVKAGSVLLLDQIARAQLAHRFLFDDTNIFGGNVNPWPLVVAKTASYPVTAADNNRIFTNQGAIAAVTFTLPTLDRGLRYRFFAEAGQNLIVESANVDELVVFNNAIGNAIAFQTVAEIIGGGIEVVANADATKWLVFVNLGAETQTPTITA